MAVRKIAFPVAFKQNTNSYSNAYGKYYPVAIQRETLSLGGLLNMCAFDQSVFTPDIVKGCLSTITKVMLELLKEGQAVKWDGLGTFTPTIENVKDGATDAQIVNGVKNLGNMIRGVHIRFIPENSDGEQLTSRKFADSCIFKVQGVYVPQIIGAGKQQKKVFNLVSLEVFRDQNN